jgi:hypothetical protein
VAQTRANAAINVAGEVASDGRTAAAANADTVTGSPWPLSQSTTSPEARIEASALTPITANATPKTPFPLRE